MRILDNYENDYSTSSRKKLTPGDRALQDAHEAFPKEYSRRQDIECHTTPSPQHRAAVFDGLEAKLLFSNTEKDQHGHVEAVTGTAKEGGPMFQYRDMA